MMTLDQAIAYGKHVGVKYYVKNNHDKIMGGTKTLEQAQKMKQRFETEHKGMGFETLTYHIEAV